DGDGRNASVSTPTPSSAQPAAARVSAAPPTRRTAAAPAGTSIIAPAAWSGENPQPPTSRSTSKNSTELSAAAVSASAIIGTGSWGALGTGGAGTSAVWTVSRSRRASTANEAAIAIGTCTRKIARQPND